MFARKMGQKSAAPRPALVSLHLAKEARHIQDRAAEHDGRIVSIGPLVLFSTDTGDAWILELADHLASKLASDGDALPVRIEESETTFAIEWQGRYRIEGDTFVYEDNNARRLVAILGYPTKHILRAIGQTTTAAARARF